METSTTFIFKEALIRSHLTEWRIATMIPPSCCLSEAVPGSLSDVTWRLRKDGILPVHARWEILSHCSFSICSITQNSTVEFISCKFGSTHRYNSSSKILFWFEELKLFSSSDAQYSNAIATYERSLLIVKDCVFRDAVRPGVRNHHTETRISSEPCSHQSFRSFKV